MLARDLKELIMSQAKLLQKKSGGLRDAAEAGAQLAGLNWRLDHLRLLSSAEAVCLRSQLPVCMVNTSHWPSLLVEHTWLKQHNLKCTSCSLKVYFISSFSKFWLGRRYKIRQTVPGCSWMTNCVQHDMQVNVFVCPLVVDFTTASLTCTLIGNIFGLFCDTDDRLTQILC